MMLGVQKVLQTLGQTAEKLRQAVGRLQGREQETRLQQHRSPSPQIWNRPRKVRLGGRLGDRHRMSTSTCVVRCGWLFRAV